MAGKTLDSIDKGFQAGDQPRFGGVLIDFHLSGGFTTHDIFHNSEHERVGPAAEIGQGQPVKLPVGLNYRRSGDELTLVQPVRPVRIFFGVY